MRPVPPLFDKLFTGLQRIQRQTQSLPRKDADGMLQPNSQQKKLGFRNKARKNSVSSQQLFGIKQLGGLNQKRGDLSDRKRKAISNAGPTKEKTRDEGSQIQPFKNEKRTEYQPRIDLNSVIRSDDDKPALSPINLQNRQFRDRKRHSEVSNTGISQLGGDKSPLESKRQQISSSK